MINVLSVASECVPLIKTGGLADVVGALPPALAAEGVEMRVMLPGYPAVLDALQGASPVWEDADLFGGPAQVLAGSAAGLSLYVLDAAHLYRRGGNPYLGPDGRDWPDNPLRYGALSFAAAQAATAGLAGWHPSVVHAHDWQAGLTPYYLRRRTAGGVASVLTIHNIVFHGLAPAGMLAQLRLDPTDFTAQALEFYGSINALKAGLVFADRLTTVSPSYGRELMRPEFGAGLDGVIRDRAANMTGILNGIDDLVWNPAVDGAIAATYTTPAGKPPNTTALRQEFGLPPADGPLCVVVSRLTEQKGLDLLLQALPALLAQGGQLALLGSGDASLEAAFRTAAEHPNVAVQIGYDEALSHRMIAGAEAILVPSRFEPCGLTQLYGLRYGTIPVVALTGGLADTVIPANPASLAAGVATGLQFTPVNAAALELALIELCALYRRPGDWTQMQTNAMAQQVGWSTSAAAYAALYGSLIPQA